ncbi:MAG: hypothetical protein ACREDL_15740 [Bradyrhizobium sp.]
MDDNLKKRLEAAERSLDPEVARFRLMAVSIFIATYEVLRSTIQDHLKDFFTDQCATVAGDLQPVESDEYKRRVLALGKKRITASLRFWRDDFKVITDADVEAFGRIATCRNHLAHRLLSILVSDGLPPDFVTCFQDMTALHRKLESWWFVNVEAAINPDFPTGADPSQAVSGPELALHLLTQVALGSSEEADKWLRGFRELREKAGLA